MEVVHFKYKNVFKANMKNDKQIRNGIQNLVLDRELINYCYLFGFQTANDKMQYTS